jgi:hypothetical protein
MSRKAVLLPALAMTGAALAATLMGCGGPVPPSADRPAAGQAAATGPTRPVPPASTSGQAVPAGDGTRVSAPTPVPAGTRPVTPGMVTTSPSPADHPATPSSAPTPRAPRPTPSPRRTGAVPADGLYIDAPDGGAHYALGLGVSKGDVISGSVSFFYSDGRIGTVGSYSGDLSGNGKLTITFGDGKDLAGRYARGTITFAGCRSVLTLASVVGCTFTYHGYAP